MSEQMSGWTRHGHRIDGMVQIGKPKTVARCGGPGLCAKCSVEAARRTDPMTPQHPAAPETETDANGLTEAERETLAKVEFATWAGQGERYDIEWADHLLPAVERIVAERVRVVEGERDAAVERSRRMFRDGDQVASTWQHRAESAEAAHEAEKAAHERLRAGVEALANEYEAAVRSFESEGPPTEESRFARGAVIDLRILGGGGAR